MTEPCRLPELSPEDLEVSFAALGELKKRIQHIRKETLEPHVQRNADRNLGIIQTLLMKLRQPGGVYSPDEVQMLYLAVDEFRALVSDVLDELPPASQVRPQTFFFLRDANALIRKLKVLLTPGGPAVDAFQGSGPEPS